MEGKVIPFSSPGKTIFQQSCFEFRNKIYIYNFKVHNFQVTGNMYMETSKKQLFADLMNFENLADAIQRDLERLKEENNIRIL